MKFKVELEVEVSGNATHDEVEEFMKYEMRFYGFCSDDNPFLYEDSGCDYMINKFEIEEL